MAFPSDRAIARVVEYDERRGTQLIDTLERHLEGQASLVAAALTLLRSRQRRSQHLRGIETLSG